MINRFFHSPWSIAVLFILVLALTIPLLTEQPFLSEPFLQVNGLLIGTITTWALMITFPLLALLFVLQTKTMQGRLAHLILGRLARLALFMGIAWGFIGNYLSHNWSFNFYGTSPEAVASSRAFWFISYTIPGLCLLCLLLTAISIAIFLLKSRTKL